MKRALLIIILISSILPCYAEDDTINRNDLILSLSYTTCEATVKKAFIDGKKFTIPESVSFGGTTFTVTRIGERAFEECHYLRYIFIPKSVKTIGEHAFFNCSNGLLGSDCVCINDLAAWCEINFSDYYSNPLSVVSSLYLNHWSEDNAVRDLIIPNSVTKIGNHAFAGYRLLSSVIIPNSVTSIGEGAFSGCTGLTSVTIPNSVTSIGKGAFEGCTGLTSVTIGNSLTSIGTYAFSGCKGLTRVNIFDLAAWCEKGFGQYFSSYSLYLNDEKISDLVIPNSVTSIEGSAFENCTGLTSVTIPNSVTSIEGRAFFGCTCLTSIDIPKSMTSIKARAFEGCTALKRVNIKDIASWCGIEFDSWNANPLQFAHHLYMNGEEITNLIIPKSVTSIGGSAFYGCTGLKSITIPNSVTSIGEYAFTDCTGITSVTIPNSVTSIGSGAFSGCTGLTSVTIPNSVTSIGNGAFAVCTGLTSVTIPNSVTNIGGWAFDGCIGLTSVTIPNSVTSIGEYAFGYSGLTSVTIPNSVIDIGRYAFADCSGMTSVTIGSSVESIGKYTFTGCTGLNTIKYFATRPFKIDESCFDNDTYNNATLIVRKGYLPTVSTLDYWSKFKNIVEGDYEEPKEQKEEVKNGDIKYSLSGNTATIVAITNKSATAIIIPEKIEYKGKTYAVTSIGTEAFSNAKQITLVFIPGSVTSIGNNAFTACTKLTSIICNSANPPSIVGGGEIFSEVTKEQASLYVPKRSMYDYSNKWGFHNTKEYIEYIKVDDVLLEQDTADGDSVVLYDISGSKRTVKKSDLPSLPRGIYIMNGKKYRF